MISAVIPLFNKRDSIARAIESVFGQTARPDELIVVNDGSTDGGDVIASDLLQRNGFGRIVNIANQGVSAARNAGIDCSRSDYVCLLDADDVWLPNHCAVMKAMIAAHPDCVLYVSGNAKRRSGSPPATAQQPFCRMNPTEFYARYTRRPSFVHTSAVAVKRSALRAMDGFPMAGIRSQDVYVWLRLAASGPTCFHPGITAVQCLDALGLGRRAGEIPYYIQFYTRSNEIPSSLHSYLRRILRRGALASWVASHSAGFDISQPLSRTFRDSDPLMAWFFRLASVPGIRWACAQTSRRYITMKAAR